MGHSDSFRGIAAYIETLPVFSDHEHHLQDDFFASGVTLDKALENSYVQWTGYVADGTTESRRKLLENARYNSYFTWFEKGLQKVHGIDERITLDSWEGISGRLVEAHRSSPDFHWQALRDCGYERLIEDAYWSPGDDMGHPEVFTPTYRIDKFMWGFHGESRDADSFCPWEHYDFGGGKLGDWVSLMLETVRKRHAEGKVAALKCAEAYNRTLKLLPDDRGAAAKAFDTHPEKITDEQRLLFGNYIFHRACELAGELGVPFQVHTGLAQLSGSQPMNVEPIVQMYPGTRFVLFHAGYPWTHQVAGIVHNYRNALPNLTWIATISTSSAIRTLHDFIDVAPSINTITWGSDCWVPEDSVGAMLAWRFVVSSVLAERIDDGRLRAPEAEALARKFMYENGRSVYGIAPA
jgi:predicted TIM-barrel fold metal-dependent hydrolase